MPDNLDVLHHRVIDGFDLGQSGLSDTQEIAREAVFGTLDLFWVQMANGVLTGDGRFFYEIGNEAKEVTANHLYATFGILIEPAADRPTNPYWKPESPVDPPLRPAAKMIDTSEGVLQTMNRYRAFGQPDRLKALVMKARLIREQVWSIPRYGIVTNDTLFTVFGFTLEFPGRGGAVPSIPRG